MEQGQINKEDENITKLKELLIKGDYYIYTKLNHVSKSGMFRLISCFVIIDNKPFNLDRYIEKLGNYKRDKNRDGLRVSGCGMDMGFDVVYNTSRGVFKEFICLGENKCKSNDHVNGDRNYKPHKHSDSGYLLKQKWL